MSLSEIPKSAARGTRWAILEALHTAGKATVQDLENQVEVKGVTVRHHLTGLQAEGMVDVQERRQSVGRPVHVYMLTGKALQMFPMTYTGLVDRVKEHPVPEVLARMASTLAADARRQLERLPDDAARREGLANWLSANGIPAKWHRNGNTLQLVKNTCPFHAQDEHSNTLCEVDEVLVREALAADVSRESCLREGGSNCTLLLGSE